MSRFVSRLVVLGVFLFCVNTVMATGQTATISRGQTKVWPINPGDTLTVYYNPDGRPCTVIWWDMWYYNWFRRPYTTMNMFGGYRNVWNLIYTSAVQPIHYSWQLYLGQGTQCKIVFKNYTNGDFVYLQIR